MSLFICQRCGNIENTALAGGEGIQTEVTEEHPHLHLMDMQGFGSIDHIEMLCCECNTGKGHGEFEYEKAGDVEYEIAKYSRYNMITPFDHPKDTIVEDDNTRFGFRALTDEERAKRKEGKEVLARFASLASVIGGSPMLDRIMQANIEYSDQSDEDKAKALHKADLKRAIKALKKSKTDAEKLKLLQDEFKSL